jgi:cytochrome c5
MKKFYLFLTATVLLIVTVLVTMPEMANSQTDTKSGAGAPLPEDVNTIFKNSCMGCHAEGGKGMAMSRVNFSKWNEYKPEKQASKAKDICKVLTKGSMPPKGFKTSHPELVPTEAQVKIICDWSATLNKN